MKKIISGLRRERFIEPKVKKAPKSVKHKII